MTSSELALAAASVPTSAPAQTLDQVMNLAKVLATSSLLPKDLRGKPADVLVAVLYGQELGVSPMQSIQSIHVINGRPTISANLWVAMVRRAGHRVRKTTVDPGRACTVEVIRSDDPDFAHTVTYTIEQAKTAGLLSNANWKSHPDAMLYARAAAAACRQGAPEVAMGFQETDEVTEPVQVGLHRVVAERDAVAAMPPEPTPGTQGSEGPTADELAELADLDDDPTFPDDPDLNTEG